LHDLKPIKQNILKNENKPMTLCEILGLDTLKKRVNIYFYIRGRI